MKARPPEYWGSKDENPDKWIRRTEHVFDANEWIENRTKVSRAKVALKGLAERWATANDHLLAPETCTWEEFKRLFRTRFRPSDFEQKLWKRHLYCPPVHGRNSKGLHGEVLNSYCAVGIRN